MNVPLTEVPDADEWAAHLAQEGKDGGCKATEITRTNGDLHKGEVIKLQLQQTSAGNKRKAEQERNKLFTHENILSQFKRGKNGRAVPAGLARKKHGKCSWRTRTLVDKLYKLTGGKFRLKDTTLVRSEKVKDV